jgi:hypothetical protein
VILQAPPTLYTEVGFEFKLPEAVPNDDEEDYDDVHGAFFDDVADGSDLDVPPPELAPEAEVAFEDNASIFDVAFQDAPQTYEELCRRGSLGYVDCS